MINQNLESEIIETIESFSGFHALDFEIISSINFIGKYDVTDLSIKMYGTPYYLSATIPHHRSESGFLIETAYNPGEIVNNEIQSVKDKRSLLNLIYFWVESIKNNMDSAYTHRKIEEQRQMINALTEEMEAQKEHFSSQEVEKMKQELNRQYELFRNELQAQFELSVVFHSELTFTSGMSV